MTKEEFMEAYGEVDVCFVYYYKYTFTFKGYSHNNEEVVINVGGDSVDIYKFEFSDCYETVNKFDPVSGSVYSKEGHLICEFEED